MSNPVLMLTHNCLELTRRCVESVQKQDIATKLFVFDNGSQDGTADWIVSQGFTGMTHPENKGVSYGWNIGLSFLFECEDVDHVLVVNNDTVLGPWTYRKLLEYNVPFVSGVSVGRMAEITEEPPLGELSLHPDFSCWVMRREAWERVGPFNERMVHYASDNAWHVQAHRKGMNIYGSPTPFFHERSSTIRLASPEESQAIQVQANKDREVFKELYGCLPWDKEYDAMFRDELFGVEQ